MKRLIFVLALLIAVPTPMLLAAPPAAPDAQLSPGICPDWTAYSLEPGQELVLFASVGFDMYAGQDSVGVAAFGADIPQYPSFRTYPGLLQVSFINTAAINKGFYVCQAAALPTATPTAALGREFSCPTPTTNPVGGPWYFEAAVTADHPVAPGYQPFAYYNMDLTGKGRTVIRIAQTWQTVSNSWGMMMHGYKNTTMIVGEFNTAPTNPSTIGLGARSGIVTNAPWQTTDAGIDATWQRIAFAIQINAAGNFANNNVCIWYQLSQTTPTRTQTPGPPTVTATLPVPPPGCSYVAIPTSSLFHIAENNSSNDTYALSLFSGGPVRIRTADGVTQLGFLPGPSSPYMLAAGQSVRLVDDNFGSVYRICILSATTTPTRTSTASPTPSRTPTATATPWATPPPGLPCMLPVPLSVTGSDLALGYEIYMERGQQFGISFASEITSTRIIVYRASDDEQIGTIYAGVHTWSEATGQYVFFLSSTAAGAQLTIWMCPPPGTPTPTTAPSLPCPVADTIAVPVAPGTATVPLQRGTRFVVGGATVYFNVGAQAREIRAGNYEWNLDPGSYTAYSLTVAATIWVCVGGDAAATVTATILPTFTPGAPSFATPFCVPLATVTATIAYAMPDLAIVIPTLRVITTPTGTITAQIAISTTAIAAFAATLQAGISTPAAAAATTGAGFSWSQGAALSATTQAYANPALQWMAILNPINPAWEVQGTPLWALAPLLRPISPLIAVFILVALARFLVWLWRLFLTVVDLVIKLIELIPGE